MKKILFICHGNICRSTMAESVFTWLVEKRGVSHMFEISSAGTSDEEEGNPVHHGTRAKLGIEGIPVVPHKARQLVYADAEKYDYFIGMDSYNISNIKFILRDKASEVKICRLLDFSQYPGDIADPWYTGNFDDTFRDVFEGCEALLDYCLRQK